METRGARDKMRRRKHVPNSRNGDAIVVLKPHKGSKNVRPISTLNTKRKDIIPLASLRDLRQDGSRIEWHVVMLHMDVFLPEGGSMKRCTKQLQRI